MTVLALSRRPLIPVPVTPAPVYAIDKARFEAWLKTAHPGSLIEYHRGHLCVDRQLKLGDPSSEMRLELHRLAARALRAADQGLVHLVQRRHGDGDYSYIAIRAWRTPPRKRGGRS